MVVGVWDLGMLSNKWYDAGVDVLQVEGVWLLEMVALRETVQWWTKAGGWCGVA